MTGETPPNPQHTDDAYVSIRAQDFLAGSKSFFDVYVRLASGKYLKLLQAGDSFTPDRLDNYIQKGVTHFYIRKEAHEEYVKYCSTLSSAVVKAKHLSTDIKTTQTLNHGEEVMKFLGSQGVTPELLAHATQFIGNVRELVQQIKPGQQDLLGSFLSDVSAYEHGVATSMLAGILAHVIEIRMEKTVHIVGMAALMHDIGLTILPKELAHENLSLMTDAQKERYKIHPALGADILRDMDGVDPAAIQAIEQHHMRPTGETGFPQKAEAGQITRVAEIIGICDEFNRYLAIARETPEFNVLAELEKNVFPAFSRQVLYAFRSAFFPKKP